MVGYMESGMGENPEGLIIPTELIEKRAEHFDPWETEALQKCALIMLRKNVQLAVVCQFCQAQGNNPVMSIMPDEHGKMVCECNCRKITLRSRKKSKRSGV
jgi:hypothetical protein